MVSSKRNGNTKEWAAEFAQRVTQDYCLRKLQILKEINPTVESF